MSLCRSCGAEIDWATTFPGGALMPVDRASAGLQGGTLSVWRSRDRKLWCRALREGEQPMRGEKWGTAHWGTCPNAKEHKKARNEHAESRGGTAAPGGDGDDPSPGQVDGTAGS